MKKIEKLLNIIPSVENNDARELIIPSESPEPENPDYDYCRTNLYLMLEQGKLALEGALRVAEESENPRSFEVFGGLLGQMATLNKTLMTIGKDREDVKTVRKGNISPVGNQVAQVTNNTAVFVGSGTDINALIKSRLSQVDN